MFSLLLHLLLLLALYQQDVPVPVLPAVKAAPLTVQIISRPQSPEKAAQVKAEPFTTEPEKTKSLAPLTSLKTAAHTKLPEKKTKANQPQNITKTASAKRKKVVTTTTATKVATASSATANTAPATVESTAEPASNQGLANRILNSVAAKQQQQAVQLSSAEIQALQQKPTERQDADVTRNGAKPAYAADNVLEVLADGSFIEKIGNYCYQAEAGADIRRDISSMKPVPCGKDANEALYNSIMDKIGQ